MGYKFGDKVKIEAGSRNNNIPFNIIGTVGTVLSTKVIQNVTVVQVETPNKTYVINEKYLKQVNK